MVDGFLTVDENNDLPAAVQGKLNATYVSNDSLPLAVTHQISTSGEASFEHLQATYASVRVGITPESKGAVGDGVAGDDTALGNAIASAKAFGAPVLLTKRYALMNRLTLRDPVVIHGPGTIVRGGATDTNWITSLTSGVEFKGITFDGADLITQIGLSIATGLSDITLRGCTFTGMRIGLTLRGTKNLDVVGNKFDLVDSGIYVYDNAGGKIINNAITQWADRGIYVDGTALGSEGLTVTHNRITAHAGGGTPRHPIQVVGNPTTPHKRIKVNYNTALGPGKSWTAVDPGTADQISMFHCADFECVGNFSSGGGDMGITILEDCYNGIVHDNICTLNDVSGITLGSGTLDAGVRNISVKGNICFGNGQNRNGDRVATSRVGIRVQASDGILVIGNITGDEQATKTQQYGLSFIDSTDVIERDNLNRGNTLGLLSWTNSVWGGRTAFAEAAGSTTITLVAATNLYVDIAYPPGRFRVPPLLSAYVNDIQMNNPVATRYDSNTASGARFLVRSEVNVTVVLQWHAVQMTPGSAGG